MRALRCGHQRQHNWGHCCCYQLHCLRPGQVQRRWRLCVLAVRAWLLLRRGLVRELRQLRGWLLLYFGRHCLHKVPYWHLCQQQREHLRALPRGKGGARCWEWLLHKGLHWLALQL